MIARFMIHHIAPGTSLVFVRRGSSFSGMTILVFSLVQLLMPPLFVRADDWPQWNGPSRDGRSAETDLLEAIPEEGLTLDWEVPTGMGYSGVSVAGGRVFIADYELQAGQITNSAGTRDRLTGRERVRCLDLDNGDEVWTHSYDQPYSISYPTGPRTVPIVHDGGVYFLGAEGELRCLDAADGRLIWRRSFPDDFAAPTPIWGHSATPLVVGDVLVCMVGGESGLVGGFDMKNGQLRWQAIDESEVGYCSPSLIRAGGVDQLLIWSTERLTSLDPVTQQVHWSHPLKPSYGMSILPPVRDGQWLFAGGEGNVSSMFRLSPDRPAAELVWEGGPKDSLTLATSGAIFRNGHLYGADISSGALTCVRADDGQRLWQTARPTTGSDRPRGGAHASAFLIQTPASTWILSETGDLITAQLSPEGYQETGRFHAIEPTLSTLGRKVLWTYPAIADGCLLVRNDEVLRCFDISDER